MQAQLRLSHKSEQRFYSLFTYCTSQVGCLPSCSDNTPAVTKMSYLLIKHQIKLLKRQEERIRTSGQLGSLLKHQFHRSSLAKAGISLSPECEL